MRLYAGHLADSLTGIAKPFEPRPDLPERPASGKNIERVADEHHPTQGAKQLTRGTVGDRAARHSRVQWATYADHHIGWHANGLQFIAPADTLGRFRYITFMAALCLPAECISFQKSSRLSRPKPVLSPLTPAQRTLIWERGDIRVEKPFIVNKFLLSTSVEIGAPELHTGYDEGLVKKFKGDPEQYARPMMNRLVELAVNTTGLAVDYAGALDAGWLPPDSPKTAKAFLLERSEMYSDEHNRKRYPDQPPAIEIIHGVAA